MNINRLTLEFYTDEADQVLENFSRYTFKGGKDERGEYIDLQGCDVRWTIEKPRVFLSPAKEVIVFTIENIMKGSYVVEAYSELEKFLETQNQPKRWANNFEEIGCC